MAARRCLQCWWSGFFPEQTRRRSTYLSPPGCLNVNHANLNGGVQYGCFEYCCKRFTPSGGCHLYDMGDLERCLSERFRREALFSR